MHFFVFLRDLRVFVMRVSVDRGAHFNVEASR